MDLTATIGAIGRYQQMSQWHGKLVSLIGEDFSGMDGSKRMMIPVHCRAVAFTANS